MARYLIVNADDFGLCRSVNRGIIECAERGILTSASLMVRQPAATEAAAYANCNRRISVGLHIDLGEWIYKDGDWVRLYKVVDTDDAGLVQKEIEWQMSEFLRLVGRPPSHLDSHQHAHRNNPARDIAVKMAKQYGLVLRETNPLVHYCGDFYGQDGEGLNIPGALTVGNLQKILESLPEGITELGCHPGYLEDLKSGYNHERLDEVRVLCDSSIREILKSLQIELCSFSDLPKT